MRKIFTTVLFLMMTASAALSQCVVKGVVREAATGKPLAGATVRLEGSMLGTYTDRNGEFQIANLKAGTYVLKISYLGFKTGKSEIEIKDGETEKSCSVELIETELLSDEVLITGVRARSNAPVAQTTIDSAEIGKLNQGQDFPFLLRWTPSVIVTSDAGAGIGYTGVRVRGSDPTRVNITINGIPYNDAESQGTFWVNMPDFASSVEDVQIQRGVGTSTNGAGAFGASINIQTDRLAPQAFATVTSMGGSYNTWRANVKAGTGLINDRWALTTRFSQIKSDGYIDRATSNLRSFFISGGYYGDKTIIKANIFQGHERTYQAWWGVHEDSLETNRTHNYYTYENEVDNYKQDHYQLHISHDFNRDIHFNGALHLTRGAGYFEQFRSEDDLSDYGIPPIVDTSDNDTLTTTTDLIRRRWLDNYFYGFTSNLTWKPNAHWFFNLGGAINRYDGDHFGEIIWARYAGNSNIRDRYYDNNGLKDDGNIYLKAEYRPTTNLMLFGDLQYRTINYGFEGVDEDGSALGQEVNFNFINPKAGLNYQINSTNRVYASFAVGNREPARNDFVESPPSDQPDHETLYDYEAGFERRSRNYNFSLNAYYMLYDDQLVLTGEVNDVGAYTRTNIDDSYRAGLEAVFSYKPYDFLRIDLNGTFSQNKILGFTEFIDEYDANWNYLGQVQRNHGTTDISFSPNTIVMANIDITPIDDLSLNFRTKYIGRQFLDNTSNVNRSIDPYVVSTFIGSYSWKPDFVKEMKFTLQVNNVFNQLYESNGYTFSYIFDGELITENYYYPQAPINFLGGVTVRL